MTDILENTETTSGISPIDAAANMAIEKIAKETECDKAKALQLWSSFSDSFVEGIQLGELAKTVSVTDISQKAEMAKAHDIRIQLMKVRTGAEKIKKALKSDMLKEGKFIDNSFNLIANATKPVEAKLLELEKFAERAEAEQRAALKKEREELLVPYGTDTSAYDLGEMAEDVFEMVLAGQRAKFEEAEARRQAEEEERKAFEASQAKRRAELEAENERIAAAKRAEEAARKKAEAEAAELRAELKRRTEKEQAEKRDEQEREQKAREAKLAEEQRIAQLGDRGRLTEYLAAVKAVDAPAVNSEMATEIVMDLLGCINECEKAADQLGEEEHEAK